MKKKNGKVVRCSSDEESTFEQFGFQETKKNVQVTGTGITFNARSSSIDSKVGETFTGSIRRISD